MKIAKPFHNHILREKQAFNGQRLRSIEHYHESQDAHLHLERDDDDPVFRLVLSDVNEEPLQRILNEHWLALRDAAKKRIHYGFGALVLQKRLVILSLFKNKRADYRVVAVLKQHFPEPQ